MSTVNSFDKNLHFSELNSPLFTGNPVPTTPKARKIAARGNLGLPTNAQAVTTTADGLTTGLISAGTSFVIITSGAATNAATLPGIAANNLPIGYTVYGRIGANGFEMVTPATSNETINGVDADGTNQLDVPANVMWIAVVESATGWTVGFSATLVTPDND